MNEEFEKLAKQKLEALKRQTQMIEHLGGGGKLDSEEKKIVKSFGGPNADILAKRAVSLHRKAKLLEVTSGTPPAQNPTELELVSRFGGPDAALASRIALGIHRKTEAMKWLNVADLRPDTDHSADDDLYIIDAESEDI